MNLTGLLRPELLPITAAGVGLSILLLTNARGRRRARRSGRVPRAKWRSDRLHERNRASASRALAQVRALDPANNPGRLFSYLRKVDPLIFEEMILSELADRGQRIRRGARYSGDGGADGAFWIDERPWLIQAKRYGATIRPEHVQAFGNLCAQRSARGLFVHTGRTGPLSRAAAQACPHVRILSGDDLVALFAGHRIALAPPGQPTAQRVPDPV